MKKYKYLAYGSNIDHRQMKDRLGHVDPGLPFVLKNYRLVFNVGFNGFANIERHFGSEVEGLVYEVTRRQLRRLDWFEGFYERLWFQSGDEKIQTYIGLSKFIPLYPVKPSLIYLNKILDGCQQAGLNKTYNELRAYKLANFKIKSSRHK